MKTPHQARILTALTVSFLLAAVGCSTSDTAVQGPPADAYVAPPDGGPSTDTGTDDVAQPTATVNFYIETAAGKELQGNVSQKSLQPADDLHTGPADTGFQLDVYVDTENVADGASVTVKVDDKVAGSGVVASNGAKITKITIPCANNDAPKAIKVEVKSGATTIDKSKAVTLSCGDVCEAIITAPVGCLVQDADGATDGFQAAFEVSSSTIGCDTAWIEVTEDIALGKSQSPEVKLQNGKATIIVKLSADAAGHVNKAAKLKAHVKDSSNADRPEGVSSEISVTVTTEKPVVDIVTPAEGKLTLADDTDASKDGLQVELKGSVTTLTVSDVDKISVDVDGVAVGKATPDGQGVFAQNLEFPSTKTYSVTVTAENACGLKTTKEVSYQVFVDKATLLITEPKAKAVLLAKDDEKKDTDTVYDTQFAVALQSSTAGSTIGVYCRSNSIGSPFGDTPVGTGLVTSGAQGLAIPVELDSTVLTTSVVCVARDDGANKAESPPVAFEIGLPPPCMKLTQPQIDIVTNGATLPVTVTATNLEGAAVTAKIALKGGATFLDKEIGNISQNNLSSDVELSVGKPAVPFPDGDYVLTVSAADKFGNKAADSTCSDLVRNFKVDRTAPTVGIAAPATQTLDPLASPDSNNSEPGYQTAVIIAVSGEPANDVIEVCVKIGNFELPCQDTAPGVQQVTFTDVTLLPGDNVISATATDAVGNKTATATSKIIKLVSDAVKVQLVSPTGDTAVAVDEITLKVNVSKDGTAIDNAGGEVRVNGAKHPDAVITNDGSGNYTAVIKNLKQGPNTIFYVALPGAVNEGVSQKITVTFKVTKPTATIASPSNGALLAKTAAECVAGSDDCKLKSLKVSTTNAADGSKVTVTADCGGAPISVQGEVAKNVMELANDLVLPNNSTCKLTAVVTDEAGQKATSASVTVTIDRTAPIILNMASPNKTKLFAADDLVSSTKGMQVAMSLRVCDLPAASVISCTVTDDDQKLVATLKSLAHGDIAPTCGNVSFGTVTLPDGDAIKLACTTADTAGNAATFNLTLLIVSDAADIVIASPIYLANKACANQAACGATGICIAGKCASPWNAKVTKEIGAVALGVADGTTARLCTNGPAPAGAADCSIAGFKIVTTAAVQDKNVTFDAKGLPDGNHTLNVEVPHPSKPGSFVNSTQSVNGGENARQRYIYADSVAPTVKTILAPQGIGVPSGCLNRKSQDKDDIAPGGTFTFAATASEDASVAIVVAGKEVGKASGEKDKAIGIPITIVQEGNVSFVAIATDLVGNTSGSVQVKTGKANEDHVFEINTVPPSAVKFLSPVKSPVIVGDSREVEIESKDKDTNGQPVTVKDGTKAITPVQALANNSVTYAHKDYSILTDGSHALTATIVDRCLNETTIATSPTNVVVDTSAPTVTVTAPLANANFADDDDADKAVGGYQVKVSFGTTGAKSYKLELGTDCDDQFKSCKFYVAQTDTAVTQPGGNEPDRFITIPFGKTTNYSIKITATDENGNSAVSEHVFTVKLSGCLVALTGLPGNGVANNQFCPTKGTDCAEVAFDLSAEFIGPCGTVDTVKLFKDSTEVGSAKPAASKATFKATFKDGEDIKLEARLFEAAKQTGSSGPTKLTVDLKAPVVQFVATDLAGFKTPATNATVLWGTDADLDTAKNDFQFSVRITVSDKSIQGGKLTKLEAVVGGSAANITGSVNLPVVFPSAADQTIDFKQGTVANNKTTIVRATAEDTNGNVGTAQFTVTVDTVAPGKLTLAAFKAADLNARRPYAKLNFTAVGDNGTTGAAATKYEVRYSRKDIASDDDFDKACDAALLSASSIKTPKAAGAADSVMVEGPDPRAATDACKFAALVDNGASKYYFAARAIDAAGNAGELSNVLSTADLRLHFTKITGGAENPVITNGARAASGIGDLDGDGKSEISLGGGSGADYCVIYGHSGNDLKVSAINISGASGTNHVCLGATKNTGRRPIQDIDVNGDGIHDLVVDWGTSDSSLAEIHVYLGVKGAKISTTAAVIIKNIPGFLTVAAMGHAGNFNGDKSAGGNAIQDFAFRVTPNATVTYDRVIIVPGNSAWSTSSPKSIDLNSQADREANNLATVHLINPTAKSNFGVGISTVGNVIPDGDGTGTQYDDLAIGQLFTPQQVVILKGQPLNKEVVFALNPGIPATGASEADKKSVRLIPAETGEDSFAFPVPVEFDGEKTPDIAILHRKSGQDTAVYWVRGKDVNAQLGKLVVLGGQVIKSGSNTKKTAVGYVHNKDIYMNYIHPLGNFFDQTGGYITIGGTRPGWATGGRTSMSIRGAFVRPETGIATEGNYGVEDLSFGDPFTPGSSNFGRGNSWGAGDFNGDGFTDIVVATGEGYAVLIY